MRQTVEFAAAELENVKDAPIAADTLQQMVDDVIIVDSLDEMGITITDAEVDQYIDEQFAPIPLSSPTATVTVEPTAAAWATQTAEAANAQSTTTAAASQTAVADASATAAAGSPTTTVSPAATGTVTAATGTSTGTTVAGSPTTAGSPDSGTPDGTPDGSPSVTETATISAEQALATSETTFRLYQRTYLDPSDMSIDDYERLIARPSLARDKIRDQLISELPSRADQVHGAHILVLTREAADAIVERLKTEPFEDVARDASTDATTAGTGGDLGWFPREAVEPAFADAAFALEPGGVSAPVPTKFGWHVIKVYEKELDRPVSLPMQQQLQGTVFDTWLDSARASADIESDIALPELVNTTTDPFQAPADAPPLPTPTPSVVASPPTGSPASGSPTVAPTGTRTP